MTFTLGERPDRIVTGKQVIIVSKSETAGVVL